jgi:hypothetical protein
MSRAEEAFSEARSALRLGPVLLPAGANLSNLLYYPYYARRYEDAMEQAVRVLELDPTIYRLEDAVAARRINVQWIGSNLAVLFCRRRLLRRFPCVHPLEHKWLHRHGIGFRSQLPFRVFPAARKN